MGEPEKIDVSSAGHNGSALIDPNFNRNPLRV